MPRNECSSSCDISACRSFWKVEEMSPSIPVSRKSLFSNSVLLMRSRAQVKNKILAINSQCCLNAVLNPNPSARCTRLQVSGYILGCSSGNSGKACGAKSCVLVECVQSTLSR
jgi:hypothetical protein